MSNIYQIQNEYLSLINAIIEAEGELTEEQSQALAINKEELQTKGINYGFVVKSLDAENDIIDAEVKRLQGLKKVRTSAIERLKSTLKQAMELYDIKELKTPLLTINFRKSESVEVIDEALLDASYVVEKVTHAPDKAKIKEAIKSGLNVMGAVIQVNQNIQIK